MPQSSLSEYIPKLRSFYKSNHRLPTQREMCQLLGFSSRNQAYRLVSRLTEEGFISKDEVGRIVPRTLLGVPFIEQGVQAGPNTLALDEELAGYVSLDEMMILDLKEPLMFVVTGDSMEGEGIYDGSMIIGERARSIKDGDVVIIEIQGGGRSVKYYRKDSKGKVRFESTSPRYKPIYPSEDEPISILGTVKWVINKK